MFLACSFWLVDALHLEGRQREPIELFERLLALRNDVGLLREEWDPVAGRRLGDTPQAFSHFLLVTSGLQPHAGRPRRSDETIHHCQGRAARVAGGTVLAGPAPMTRHASSGRRPPNSCHHPYHRRGLDRPSWTRSTRRKEQR